MTEKEFKNILVKTFKMGQQIVFKEFDLNLFKAYQDNVLIIMQAFESLNLDENIEKVLREIDTFSETEYTIDGSGKLFYFFAAFRTHGLRFLTKNTYKQKVKRYIFDVNFKLDYAQNLIEI
jgi:hypothetical protein